MVKGLRGVQSVTAARKSLHWLPVKQRIDFKVLMLIYKSLHGLAPKYLVNMFHKRGQKGRRHDPDDVLLIVPFTSKYTFAERSLSVYGPKLWYSLTKEHRQSSTLEQFKLKTKTWLFKQAYEG